MMVIYLIISKEFVTLMNYKRVIPMTALGVIAVLAIASVTGFGIPNTEGITTPSQPSKMVFVEDTSVTAVFDFRDGTEMISHSTISPRQVDMELLPILLVLPNQSHRKAVKQLVDPNLHLQWRNLLAELRISMRQLMRPKSTLQVQDLNTTTNSLMSQYTWQRAEMYFELLSIVIAGGKLCCNYKIR